MAERRKRSRRRRPSRRQFLKTAAGSAPVLILPRAFAVPLSHPQGRAPEPGGFTRLSEHLLVFRGSINVGIVLDGPNALLIDCADGVNEKLQERSGSRITRIVFTHHHRDQACGAPSGAKIGVPAAERGLFDDPSAYWNDDKNLWRVYRSFRPHPLTLTDPLRVDEAFADGHQIAFGPAKIRVVDTPGHTEGSVSYRVEVDGKRVVFCGDCLYDEGRIWDLYSLQKGFARGGRRIGGYHGFMGDRWRLVESLKKIKDLRPATLVPSHGSLMENPAKAVDTLIERLETCYEKYVAISALRHYFPKLFSDYDGRPGQMPIRPGIKPPDCLRHFGTTWMLVSKTGAALVMDVGSPRIVDRIKGMLKQGEIKSVEGLWVTHYHFDHTDGIRAFQKEFDCPCIMDRRLAAVLTRPTAWRLPCLMPDPIRVEKPMEDGQSWRWHEFKLTSYAYPGQTLYHDALLAEGGDARMLFVGDSHTPAGIDDYCAYNRNFLGRKVGFQRCISLIEKLQPTHLFNCHVADAFTYTPEEILFMRRNLDERERLFGSLVPWEHANYGMDASWVRCFPYTQKTRPGAEVGLDVVVTNHAPKPTATGCRARLPKALGGTATPWAEADVPARAEQSLPVSFPIPPGARPGRYVIPVDVRHGSWDLPLFTEAIVDVV